MFFIHFAPNEDIDSDNEIVLCLSHSDNKGLPTSYA